MKLSRSELLVELLPGLNAVFGLPDREMLFLARTQQLYERGKMFVLAALTDARLAKRIGVTTPWPIPNLAKAVGPTLTAIKFLHSETFMKDFDRLIAEAIARDNLDDQNELDSQAVDAHAARPTCVEAER
jgi:hypothetical protein